MPSVILIDTCVLLNILNVEGFNQSYAQIMETLATYIDDDSNSLILPFAAILETGNHIGHLSDGRNRRRFAQIFVDQVIKAINGDAPWRPSQTLDLGKMAAWLATYPDLAMRGIGIGDATIIREWEEACERHPFHHVRIWSLDGGLIGYDRRPLQGPLML